MLVIPGPADIEREVRLVLVDNMEPWDAALIALLTISVVQLSSCEVGNATTLSMQLDTLLAEYDRDAPPAAWLSVHVDLDIKHAAVDQDRGSMRILADLKMSWMDPRIWWNATEWGSNSTLVAAEQLWLPDLVLLNAAGTTSPGDDSLRARISAYGAISWINRIDVTVPLDMDLSRWPYDSHTGNFKFGSRMFTSEELELDVGEFQHTTVFETGAWEILSIRSRTWAWARGDADTSVAEWAVGVARRAEGHAAAARTLLLAAGLLLVAAALLPTQRHALAATASFITALWLVWSAGHVSGGRGVSRVATVACALCASGAAYCACAAAAARLARCSAPPPRRLRAVLSALAGYCCLTPSQEEGPTCGSGAWAAAAALADRLITAALLITLFVLLIVYLS